ncbi:MAG: DUF4956 domain-containing protein [Aeromicrobium sp.]|uniref:DUF4956 domain-containing protein n=1 Tax=Aeromicrobium sp. TaxID=1871063 RepID=UPI003C4193B5
MSDASIDLLARTGINLAAMLVLIGLLYRPKQSVASMPLVLASLNAGLFGALAAITGGEFAAGIGFGLFGLLSLLRLRSAAFTIKDVAYTFISLILGLVNGLPDRDFVLTGVVNAALLIVVWVADDSRSKQASRVMRLTLERAVTDPTEVKADLVARLSVEVLSVVIEEIDFVRETTLVTVLYVASPGAAAVTSAEQLAQPRRG